MIIAGIDPGLHGGMALLDTESTSITLIPLPVIENKIDIMKFSLMIPDYIDHVFIESLLVFPGKCDLQKISTSGKNWGRIVAYFELDNDRIPITEVMPKDWQRGLLVPSGPHSEIKQRILKRAKTMFPTVNFIPKGCRKPHDGIVDALMIAKYGQMQLRRHL